MLFNVFTHPPLIHSRQINQSERHTLLHRLTMSHSDSKTVIGKAAPGKINGCIRVLWMHQRAELEKMIVHVTGSARKCPVEFMITCHFTFHFTKAGQPPAHRLVCQYSDSLFISFVLVFVVCYMCTFNIIFSSF